MSREQVQGYSLSAQRRLIAAEVARRGHEIVAEFSDEGKSAHHDSLAKRPGLRGAIAAVKAGLADGIIVHKPDRLARNLQVLLMILSELGGGVLAVEGDFDYTSPEGKFRAHLLGSVAQLYSDNLSREVRKGKDERRRQGYWNGRLPFGLRKQDGDEHGRMVPVRDDVPVLSTIADRRPWSRWDALVLIFERCAAGTSLPRIVEELHTLGFPLGLGTIWEILNNRFYLGEVPIIHRKPRRYEWVPGAHQAFIDPELFERAARARQQNRRGAATIRRQAHVYSLSGVCRCRRCGESVHCRTDSRGRSKLYCYRRQKRTKAVCDQPQIPADVIEQQLAAFLKVFSPPEELRDWTVAQVRAGQRDTRRERAALEGQLRRLADLYTWGDLAQAEYRAKRQDLESRLAALDVPEVSPELLQKVLGYLQDFNAAYSEASPQQRNALLHALVECVEVDAEQPPKVHLHPILDAIMRSHHADAFGSSPTTA
jgi:DNA invertase Pin-like site-specific DNA recombinase